MAFSLRQAEAYVLSHGEAWQRACWKAVFGYGPVEGLLFELMTQLSDQGDWTLSPEVTGPQGPLGPALFALRLLAPLNLGEDVFQVWERTVRHLRGMQAPDGSWGQDHQVYWTAAIGGYLRDARAREYVRLHAREEGDDRPTQWALLALDGVCHERLLAAVVGEALDPCDLVRIHESAVQAGLGPEDPLRRAVRARLGGLQEVDGSWKTTYGEAQRVSATLFAARALVAL